MRRSFRNRIPISTGGVRAFPRMESYNSAPRCSSEQDEVMIKIEEVDINDDYETEMEPTVPLSMLASTLKIAVQEPEPDLENYFVCELCGTKFFDYFKLIEHDAAAHSEELEVANSTMAAATIAISGPRKKPSTRKLNSQETIKCADCPKSFKTTSTLKKHLLQFHKKESSKLGSGSAVKGQDFVKSQSTIQGTANHSKPIKKRANTKTQKLTLEKQAKGNFKSSSAAKGKDFLGNRTTTTSSKPASSKKSANGKSHKLGKRKEQAHKAGKSSSRSAVQKSKQVGMDRKSRPLNSGKANPSPKVFAVTSVDGGPGCSAETDAQKLRTDNEELQCSICFKTFSRRCNLLSHMRVHETKTVADDFFEDQSGDEGVDNFDDAYDENTFEVPSPKMAEDKCSKRKVRNRAVRRKVAVPRKVQLKVVDSEPSKPYKCDTCDKGFYSSIVLKRHVSAAHPPDLKLKCKVCSAEFKSRRALSCHRQEMHPDPTKCHICQVEFEDRKALKAHNDANHKSESAFPCNVCGREFRERRLLKDHHLRCHTNDRKTHYCNEKDCTFSTKRKAYIRNHMIRAHTNIRNFICSECGRAFKLPPDLKMHMVQVHSEVRNFMCSQCGHTCKTKTALTLHSQVHEPKLPKVSDTRNFKCTKCDKSFMGKSQLRIHLIKHSGEKKFLCQYCPRSFFLNAILQCHINKRHPEHSKAEFACQHCSQAFNRMSDLEKHVLSKHSAKDVDRPYICTVCDAGFKHISALKNHTIRLHTDEKPFPCDNCDLQFKTIVDIRRHKIRCGNDPTMQCEFCPKAFYLKYELKVHIRNRHSKSADL